MRSPPCRFLIVVFDSLRPDSLSANQTPNLYEFCRGGAVFSKSRAVFPTLTRVNKVSLVTGVPVLFGVLTVDTEAQAIARAGGPKAELLSDNKGAECAFAAIETVEALRLAAQK